MNRLFLRLYVLVSLCTLSMVAGVTVFVGLRLLPEHNQSVNGLVAPSLRALAERIDRGEDPRAVIASAEAATGPALALLDPTLVPYLTPQAMDDLRRGDVLTFGSGLERYAYAWVDARDEVLELELAGVRHRATQWAGLALRRGDRSAIHDGKPAGVTPLVAARAAWRPSPIPIGEGLLMEPSQLIVQQGLDGRWQYAVADPEGPQDLRLPILGWMLLATAIALLVPLVPLHRQLAALGRAAGDLREGDLEARVPMLAGGGPVHPVAEQFNHMAQRVQDTIRDNETLLHSVAHEMRTPVARLLFSLDLLEDDDDDARVDRIDTLRRTAHEMRELTDELLSFARLGATSPELERAPVDLAEVVDDVAVRWDGTTVVRDDDAAMVEGDVRLLDRALDNLVRNAVRYASPPTVTLRRHGDDWVVWVDDDGPGIPADQRQQVFEPFVRLEASRSRDHGGSGLGLAIVARVVGAHGGQIAVEDSPRGGARFTVRLPAR